MFITEEKLHGNGRRHAAKFVGSNFRHRYIW